MALTHDGIDKAVITKCVEIDKGYRRDLGWSFIQFADASESFRYVQPVGCALHVVGAQPYRVTEEPMLNAPFPYDLHAPRHATGDFRIPGPHAVHYFGVGV
jgi:hypothetical protein